MMVIIVGGAGNGLIGYSFVLGTGYVNGNNPNHFSTNNDCSTSQNTEHSSSLIFTNRWQLLKVLTLCVKVQDDATI